MIILIGIYYYVMIMFLYYQQYPAFHTIQINAITKYKYYVLVLRELSHSGAGATTVTRSPNGNSTATKKAVPP